MVPFHHMPGFKFEFAKMGVSGTPSPRVTVPKILVAEDKEAPNAEISNW